MTALETRINSVGPPPEMHADRVVANMLRQLAEQRASITDLILGAIKASKDGGPRAQARMAERIKNAGAVCVHLLETGKRGRYRMDFYEMTGWDPTRDSEIRPYDPIPKKPWIGFVMTKIHNKGKGRLDFRSGPVLFVTHHALSRTAQRRDLRTGEHLFRTAHLIWNGVADFMNNRGWNETLDSIPPEGYRVPFDEERATVVVRKHETRDALVAATVL